MKKNGAIVCPPGYGRIHSFLSLLNRLAAQIPAVEFKQIECAMHRAGNCAVAADQFKDREAVYVANDSFAVDHKEGWIRFVPRKTRHRRKRISEKPILPVLADIIAKSPIGNMTFLITKYGNPFTAAGFGGWFRARCDEANLPHCTAHGLRKAGATTAAENGATDRQLMALYDWTTANQATLHTLAADRKRLAADAAALIANDQTENKALSHSVVSLEKTQKRSGS